MSTHNLRFEQKYEKYQNFCLKIFILLVVNFSIYLNRRVFVMKSHILDSPYTQTDQSIHWVRLSGYTLNMLLPEPCQTIKPGVDPDQLEQTMWSDTKPQSGMHVSGFVLSIDSVYI